MAARPANACSGSPGRRVTAGEGSKGSRNASGGHPARTTEAATDAALREELLISAGISIKTVTILTCKFHTSIYALATC